MLGLTFSTVPRVSKKEIAIEMVRDLMPRVWFDEGRCEQGLQCLKNYRRKINKVTKQMTEKPVHDWASHGADAFMTLAQSEKNRAMDRRRPTEIIENKLSGWS